jgi:beta-galactosidase
VSTIAERIQERLRRERACFHAVVFFRPGCRDASELAKHFEIIADTGFDSVRCHNFEVERDHRGEIDYSIPDAWLEAAARTGVKVILHLTKQRTPDGVALDQVGLTREEFDVLDAEDPRYRNALSLLLGPPVERYRDADALLGWGGFGEPGRCRLDLETDEDRRQFTVWLRRRYESVEELDAAWNLYPETGPVVRAFEDAWELARLPEGRVSINGASNAKVNYGAQRDRYRFAADRNLARTASAIEVIRERDPNHPILTGSHQLFLNQPSLGWDIPKWAKLGDCHFSSIHMSWHFEPVGGEIDRPVYFQARQTRDYFKGGWTSAFETTGGPVQFSGGYGNHMDAGLMRRLCLAYLAAGNQNLAFWTWNHRPGGWEGGEYGMTSLSGRVTEWAKEAGQIAQAARHYVADLWEAEDGADVGLIQSWDTDVIQLFEPERHDLSRSVGNRAGSMSRGTRLCHERSWIGYSRALLNSGVSWQYLTEEELAPEIVSSYPVLVAPFLRAISQDTIETLSAYVENGGVLIADLAFGYYDRWGKLRPVGPGSSVERLFGAWIDQVHDNRTGTRSLWGQRIPGFYGDIATTEAVPVLCFDDGLPAAVRYRVGRGSTVLAGFDVGTFCFAGDAGYGSGQSAGSPAHSGAATASAADPHLGRAPAEAAGSSRAFQHVFEHLVRSFVPRRFSSSVETTIRLRAPKADHYFILNDGPRRDAILTVFDAQYDGGIDVLTGTPVDTGEILSVPVPARSGSWIRLDRST